MLKWDLLDKRFSKGNVLLKNDREKDFYIPCPMNSYGLEAMHWVDLLCIAGLLNSLTLLLLSTKEEGMAELLT